MYYDDYVITTTTDFDPTWTVIFSLIILALTFIGYWRIFVKAEQPGWGGIIPIYNQYVLSKITFGTGWLFLLLLIPFVNIIYVVVLAYKLSQAFGHGIGYAIGLIFLPFVFYLILGFDDSEYLGVQE